MLQKITQTRTVLITIVVKLINLLLKYLNKKIKLLKIVQLNNSYFKRSRSRSSNFSRTELNSMYRSFALSSLRS